MPTYPHSCRVHPDNPELCCRFVASVLIGGKVWDAYQCNGCLLFRYGEGGAEYAAVRRENLPLRVGRHRDGGSYKDFWIKSLNEAWRLIQPQVEEG